MIDHQLQQAFDSVSIVKLGHALGFVDLREGAGQRNPFRDDKRAGSFSVMKAGFKDFAGDDCKGGHIKFVQLARPGWDKKKAVEFIFEVAGIVPEKQSKGSVRRVVKEKRGKLYEKAKDLAADLPRLGMEEPGPMSQSVRSIWNDGQSAIIDVLPKLAATRGWDESIMRALVGLNKTSLPTLPWSESSRGWGWVVEKPVFQGMRAALVPVGFHARYKIFGKDETGARTTAKRWVYVPYVPTTPGSDFQKQLAAAKVRLPAYPFVLGQLTAPRLVIITEGQFDTVSIAAAFGWMGVGRAIPAGVVVFGLRGVSSPGVFLAAYGAWIRRHKPFVWVIGDNDEAGHALVRRKNTDRITAEPCFIDRLRAQGCEAMGQFLQIDGCKDFNDVYRDHNPSQDQMLALADVAGCRGLIQELNEGK